MSNKRRKNASLWATNKGRQWCTDNSHFSSDDDDDDCSDYFCSVGGVKVMKCGGWYRVMHSLLYSQSKKANCLG